MSLVKLSQDKQLVLFSSECHICTEVVYVDSHVHVNVFATLPDTLCISLQGCHRMPICFSLSRLLGFNWRPIRSRLLLAPPLPSTQAYNSYQRQYKDKLCNKMLLSYLPATMPSYNNTSFSNRATLSLLVASSTWLQ